MEYIRENIITSHSLHDMRAGAVDAEGDVVTLRLDGGLVRCAGCAEQVAGAVAFRGVDWDFCFVYILRGFTANAGEFRGEKMALSEFIKRYPRFDFEIIDACYGYNQTKLSGWLWDDELSEMTVEIYHAGDMVFIES